ncbi:septum site-determining protein MinC [Biformimicrobium ophioploci]|uniref:Probable septum site-determining protein MinC n=1 Tax=Biformimicrobium ophioploci TaxID=3036711 RepID=A0ABQ6LYW8_9GAMM|nr:septum site-determining protein MinC [Microbulbifer sp. NKW57]GMG87270.1 septum site-determining protein MinC [Microbulbifer sp. NKW57]
MGTPFKFKGSLVPLTILELQEFEPHTLATELQKSTAKNAAFLAQAPVVVSLEHASDVDGIDLEGLLNACREHGIRPIGVKAPDALASAISDAQLAHVHLGKHRPAGEHDSGAKKTEEAPESQQGSTMVVDKPVRSGQQIYARDADLIVTASVSPGAEIIADGNIHVYGRLAGRAIAGASGNQDARIFCRALLAELISIAGCYKLSDDFPKRFWGNSIQVSLEDDALRIQKL